jgi:hypothetical protein
MAGTATRNGLGTVACIAVSTVALRALKKFQYCAGR